MRGVVESPTVLPAGGDGTWTRWRWVLFCVFLFGFILLPFVLFERRINALVQDSLQSGTSLTLIALAPRDRE